MAPSLAPLTLGLGLIASSDDSFRTMLALEVLAKVKSVYVGLSQSNPISRSMPLEAALGINLNSPN